MRLSILLYFISLISLSHAYTANAGEYANNTGSIARINDCFNDAESEKVCWNELLIKKTADQMYDFGVHYANGDGVTQSIDKGRYWIHNAAINGYPLAQYNLGVMFFDGLGGVQSQECAHYWLSKAAQDSGESGPMAAQALAAMANLVAENSSTAPKIYRALTPSECEQLPHIELPVIEAIEAEDLVSEESVSGDNIDSDAMADTSLSFTIGLDVLSTKLLDGKNTDLVAVNSLQQSAATASDCEDATDLSSEGTTEELEQQQPHFRKKMGHYFIHLGNQLLEEDANKIAGSTTPETVDSKILENSRALAACIASTAITVDEEATFSEAFEQQVKAKKEPLPEVNEPILTHDGSLNIIDKLPADASASETGSPVAEQQGVINGVVEMELPETAATPEQDNAEGLAVSPPLIQSLDTSAEEN